MIPHIWEVLDFVLRGAVIAVVGILLYVMQKRSEMKANKRDMARILRNEINRTPSILPGSERERTVSSRNDRIPNSDVYPGLLQTGNIRFFDDRLQDELAGWYSFTDDFQLSGIDADAGIEMVQDLERMERKNRPCARMFRGK